MTFVGPCDHGTPVADFEDYDDDPDGWDCQTCGGDGFEECNDCLCFERDCNGLSHTCPNCKGSGNGKDQWYW